MWGQGKQSADPWRPEARDFVWGLKFNHKNAPHLTWDIHFFVLKYKSTKSFAECQFTLLVKCLQAKIFEKGWVVLSIDPAIINWISREGKQRINMNKQDLLLALHGEKDK